MSSATTSGTTGDPAALRWHDALLAAGCIAVDPLGLGGIRVLAAAGPVRDAWVARWRGGLPASTPVRPVPLRIDEDRLLGGLDLAASLRTGRAVLQPGLLAQVDGGFVVLAMAERIDAGTAARIAGVIDVGGVAGLDTRFASIAFDEGDAGEGLAESLAERLALCIDLRDVSIRDVQAGTDDDASAAIDGARIRLPSVTVDDAFVGALCAAATALGIDSMRMPLFAIRAARAIAALDGRDAVDADDAARAARLVYGSRARQLPADEAEEAVEDRAGPAESSGTPDPTPPEPAEPNDVSDDPPQTSASRERLDDVVLEAAISSMPPDLLKRLADGAHRQRTRATARSGAGASMRGRARGAPCGVRRRRPRGPERLSLVDTLRAAAPWQRIRHAGSPDDGSRAVRVQVRADDLHVVRFRQRQPTTTVFVVDASGSAALHRLAEAKGAVELLLADCYVRRDHVAVIAFRGRGTQLLLAPTRSLVLARRSLAGLPGGGGTPLASALDATRELVTALRSRGDTVLTVLLTDGRANVARDGSGGRPKAEAEALDAARALRRIDADVLLIDTSPQSHPQAVALADAMGATYRLLPHAGAREMSRLVNRAAREAALR